MAIDMGANKGHTQATGWLVKGEKVKIFDKSLAVILVIMGAVGLAWELICHTGGNIGIALSVLFLILASASAFRAFKTQRKAR